MVETVTINSITGTSDYDVWVSNGCAESEVKVYIDTISDSDIPYTFNLPAAYQNSAFCVKIYDDNDCTICDCFGVAPSPSPSMTPSITPTSTVSPTMTPTPSTTPPCQAPTYLYGSFNGNGFSENATYTLSSTLYNGRNQWISPNNGTVRWNGYRWEVAGWNLAGVTFFNINTQITNAPDENSWTYSNCGEGFTCSVSFTSEGCGTPEESQTPTPTPSESAPTQVSQTPTSTPTTTVTPTVTPSITPSSSGVSYDKLLCRNCVDELDLLVIQQTSGAQVGDYVKLSLSPGGSSRGCYEVTSLYNGTTTGYVISIHDSCGCE